jgi:hypothetical protein
MQGTEHAVSRTSCSTKSNPSPIAVKISRLAHWLFLAKNKHMLLSGQVMWNTWHMFWPKGSDGDMSAFAKSLAASSKAVHKV